MFSENNTMTGVLTLLLTLFSSIPENTITKIRDKINKTRLRKCNRPNIFKL